jgi:hypothetical protein
LRGGAQGLPKVVSEAETDLAQRFLTSAYDSVNGVLETLGTVRKVRSEKAGKEPRAASRFRRKTY